MQGIYICPSTIEMPKFSGVRKKVEDHLEILKNNNINLVLVKLNLMSKLNRLLPFVSSSLNWNKIDITKTRDVIYIRYILSDYQFISMLRRLRRQSPNVKIIIEFPTYPYDKENTLRQFPIILKDRFYRRQLHQFVDKAVTFGSDKEIFGIPTICTKNGINVSNISAREGKLRKDQIHLIAVAMFSKWHGYDRFIKGLHLYYQSGGKKNIVLHLVGDGEEIKKYQRAVEKYQLKNCVIFHGVKSGKELNEIYNSCGLSLASLGLHRIGLNLGSFLKTREYLAKGLPMITGCKIDVFENSDYPYYLEFPSDESPIDIEKVIAFYDQIYIKSGKTQEEIVGEIRDFAYRTCDMSVTMKPIIDYIKSSGNEQGVAE